MDLPFILPFVGHEERAWHVAWNPTKPLLASCSADKSVRLYSYNTINSKESTDLEFQHITTIDTGHSKTVRALAWAPSGKTLATASFDSNIGIWEQEASSDDEREGGEWECASLLEGHETECKSVSYSNSGTLLASCSRDKTVWIWEGSFRFIVVDLNLSILRLQSTRTLISSAWVCLRNIRKMSNVLLGIQQKRSSPLHPMTIV